MRTNPFLSGLRVGLVSGAVTIFLFLIGFMNTGAAITAKLLGRAPAPNTLPAPADFVAFMALLGLLYGVLAARRQMQAASSMAAGMTAALVSGLAAGLAAGVLSGATGWLFGVLSAAKVDPRVYLVALSPDAIRLFLFGLPPVTGALALVAVLAAGGLLGAGLALAWRTWAARPLTAGRRRLTQLYTADVAPRFAASPALRYAAWALLAVALLILPRTWGSYWNYVLGTVGIYVLLGLGLNMITGIAGQLVIGYVAFFGVGAYTFALLSAPAPHHILMNFWLALFIAMLAAGLTGLLLGLPILSLRGDYLAIVTLGFAEIVRILLKSDLLTGFTGGPKGVRDIGGPTLFGQSFNSDVDFVYLIIIAVAVTAFLANRLQRSHIGRGWEAVREDETVARATGVHAYRSKLLALTLSAVIAGLAGVVCASRNQFTGPEDHSLLVAINVICLVIVGGVGSIPGIILGAFALKGLPEVLREMENYRMLVFGALLVMMMNLRPEGFWPAARPRLEGAASAGAAAAPASAPTAGEPSAKQPVSGGI